MSSQFGFKRQTQTPSLLLRLDLKLSFLTKHRVRAGSEEPEPIRNYAAISLS